MAKLITWIFLWSLLPLPLFPAEPIADEASQREILNAIFPGMAVQVTAGRSMNASRRAGDHRRRNLCSPDALAVDCCIRSRAGEDQLTHTGMFPSLGRPRQFRDWPENTQYNAVLALTCESGPKA
jgi:hypothetical protein